MSSISGDEQHGKLSLGCEKSFLITMIELVFVILKHSLQWRGEFHLYLDRVPQLLLFNSTAKRFSTTVSFEGKIFLQLSFFADAFVDHIW